MPLMYLIDGFVTEENYPLGYWDYFLLLFWIGVLALFLLLKLSITKLKP